MNQVTNEPNPGTTEAIKKILGTKATIPDYRFTFGKYKQRSLEYVWVNDKKYLHWLLSEDFISERLRETIESILE